MPPGETYDWRLQQLEAVDAGDRLTMLEAQVKSLEDLGPKMDSIKTWLVGILGGLIVSLILLALNLAISHK